MSAVAAAAGACMRPGWCSPPPRWRHSGITNLSRSNVYPACSRGICIIWVLMFGRVWMRKSVQLNYWLWYFLPVPAGEYPAPLTGWIVELCKRKPSQKPTVGWLLSDNFCTWNTWNQCISSTIWL